MPAALEAHGRKTRDLGLSGPPNALPVKNTRLPTCLGLRHGVGSSDSTGWKPVAPVPNPSPPTQVKGQRQEPTARHLFLDSSPTAPTRG